MFPSRRFSIVRNVLRMVAAGLIAIAILVAIAPRVSFAISTSTTSTTQPLAPACAQPITTGAQPSATDCLFILRVAVALAQCIPSCVCDVNGDLATTATDALTCLSVAVGVDLPLACPCFGTTSTTLPAETGACCLQGTGGTPCVIEAPLSCGGVYIGPRDGPTCSRTDDRLCARSTNPGACCVANVGCFLSIEAGCNRRYLGDGTDCALCDGGSTTTTTLTTTTTTTTTTTLPTGPTGKCCTGAGACEIITEAACLESGGEYGGDDPNAACSLADILSCALLRVE